MWVRWWVECAVRVWRADVDGNIGISHTPRGGGSEVSVMRAPLYEHHDEHEYV